MEKLWRAVCPIRQYDDKLELQCNSFRKGHTHLVWYNTANPEDKKESEILAPVVTITGLEQGEYAFSTRNDESSSIRIYVQIIKETAEEAVNRIEQYVDGANQHHQGALKLLRERLKADDNVRPISALIALYRALGTQNADRLKAYFQLIAIAQYCDNYRSLHMNTDNEAPVRVKNEPQASIELGAMVSKIVVHKVMGGVKSYYSTIQAEYKADHDLQLFDNGEYLLEAYADDNLVGVYVHFSGNDTTKQWLWANKSSYMNKTTDAVEQLLDLPAEYSIFTEEEQKKILIEKAKNPFDELVSRPQVEAIKDKININIEDFGLLGTIGGKFYVVAKEPDQLFCSGFDRAELITGTTVVMDKSKHLLFDTEDYYFYIQDESKRLVSKLGLLSLSGEDYSDYSEHLRQLELYNYKKRLMQLIEYHVPAASVAVNEILELAKNQQDVNTANVYKYLISQLNTNKHLTYFNGAVGAIMEDKLSHGLFTQSFFSNGIKLERAIDKLIFPPKANNYVLQVDKIYLNSNTIVTEYHESGAGAIEVQSRGADYFIYQAIDKQSYRRSGYVFVSTAKHTPGIMNWNIDIEVI
jgi:hypothetical protein